MTDPARYLLLHRHGGQADTPWIDPNWSRPVSVKDEVAGLEYIRYGRNTLLLICRTIR